MKEFDNKRLAGPNNTLDNASNKEGSDNKCEFALFFDAIAKKRGLNRSNVAFKLDIDPERFKKIINRNNPTKQRDCIIACCFVLQLDVSNTDKALRLYDFPQLDQQLPREKEISRLLNEQAKSERPKSIKKINEILAHSLGAGKELHIIDHRKRKNTNNKNERLKELVNRGIHVECSYNKRFQGRKIDSFPDVYSPEQYRIMAKMELFDLLFEREYELIAEPDGKYVRVVLPNTDPECVHHYKSIEETRAYRSFFEIIQGYAQQVLANKTKLLEDSRNYKDRVSARIIDNRLHIFTEAYNYSIPDLNEYFLLDYADGVFQFTVSDKSRFMELYLSKEDYKRYYGTSTASIKLSFDSEEEINKSVSNVQDNSKRRIAAARYSAYKQMRKIIMVFSARIKEDGIFQFSDSFLNRENHINNKRELESGVDVFAQEEFFNGYDPIVRSLTEIIQVKEKDGTLKIDTKYEHMT